MLKIDKKLKLFSENFMKFDAALRKDYAKVEIPVMLSQVLWAISVPFQTAILGHLSSDAIAANSVATTFYQYLKVCLLYTSESEKFFKNAKMAISFEGRTLTQEEEYQIIETITENTSISIICIVDNDETHADLVKQQIEAYYDSVSGREGEFYRGTLRSGQVLESVSSVVIVGDVNPGAKIISQGNICLLYTSRCV